MPNQILRIILVFFLCFGCQKNAVEETAQQAAIESDKPQLKKIAIKSRDEAESLIQQGLDVIVVEEDYVVVRLDGTGEDQVQALNFKTEKIKESDLVQRLAQIITTEKTDASELSSLGIDIWEVKGDTVVAQVFDKHLRQIEEKGYTVTIIEKNVLDVLKKTSQK